MPDRGENQEKERSTLASGQEAWYIYGVFPHARLSSAVKRDPSGLYRANTRAEEGRVRSGSPSAIYPVRGSDRLEPKGGSGT